MVGSEVYSTEIKKTEVLMENFRRAIGEYWRLWQEFSLAQCSEAALLYECLYDFYLLYYHFSFGTISVIFASQTSTQLF